MAKSAKRLGNATFVSRGYGQVEPNHLSAPRNGQVYAQLPAAADIEILENGQFVKYDYAAGVCDFSTDTSAGAWMMVYNETHLYEDRMTDADFAMIRENYVAYAYSPLSQNAETVSISGGDTVYEGTTTQYSKTLGSYNIPGEMPEGSTMVPRVFKISIGDIWTTNTIMAEPGSLSQGGTLKIGEDGYLTSGTGAGGDADPTFVIVKVYTTPDLQPAVKIQRVA